MQCRSQCENATQGLDHTRYERENRPVRRREKQRGLT